MSRLSGFGLKIEDKVAILRRLNKHTLVTDSHWRWIGSTTHTGHGETQIEGKHYLVSRLSAYIHLGLDLHSDLQANHKDAVCAFLDCWNPEHLYVGTQHQNVRDMQSKRLATSEFPCSHPREEHNIWSDNGILRCRQCRMNRSKQWRAKKKVSAHSVLDK